MCFYIETLIGTIMIHGKKMYLPRKPQLKTIT